MIPDDEKILAWLDGALEPDGAAHMTDLAARDETFARRVERLRHLDDLVRAAVPEEPEIPAALLARLGLAEPPVSAAVVDIAAARQVRAARQATVAPLRIGRPIYFKVAAQVAVIAVAGLAVALFAVPGQRADDPAAEYRVLGSAAAPAAPKANALIKFAPGLAKGDETRIAASVGLSLIGGPNAAGAWKADVAPGRRDAVLQALRADARVVMAEPIDEATP